MSHLRKPRALVALALLIAATSLAACGGGGSGGSGGNGASGNGTDRAFVADMIPHHRSAVEMARTAKSKTHRSEIKQLATNIIATQSAEISTLSGIGKQLDAAGVKPGKLPVAGGDMGMNMDAGMLKTARPFDREFIDMMIPHHQGAIRMARAELAHGANAELKKIAQAIVGAQSKEIDQLNTWRVDWYGKMSPAGGVPSDTSSGGGDMSGMDMG